MLEAFAIFYGSLALGVIACIAFAPLALDHLDEANAAALDEARRAFHDGQTEGGS